MTKKALRLFCLLLLQATPLDATNASKHFLIGEFVKLFLLIGQSYTLNSSVKWTAATGLSLGSFYNKLQMPVASCECFVLLEIIRNFTFQFVVAILRNWQRAFATYCRMALKPYANLAIKGHFDQVPIKVIDD